MAQPPPPAHLGEEGGGGDPLAVEDAAQRRDEVLHDQGEPGAGVSCHRAAERRGTRHPRRGLQVASGCWGGGVRASWRAPPPGGPRATRHRFPHRGLPRRASAERRHLPPRRTGGRSPGCSEHRERQRVHGQRIPLRRRTSALTCRTGKPAALAWHRPPPPPTRLVTKRRAGPSLRLVRGGHPGRSLLRRTLAGRDGFCFG